MASSSLAVLLQQTTTSAIAASSYCGNAMQQVRMGVRQQQQLSHSAMSHFGGGMAEILVASRKTKALHLKGSGKVSLLRVSAQQDSLKRAVAKKVIELVKSGMVVGLGTGSTSYMAIEELGALISQNKLKNIVGVATSYQSRVIARQFGVKTVDLNDINHIDMAFDGADEVPCHHPPCLFISQLDAACF
jgi:hypothetical protein